jgi:hypothetical protein
VESKHLQSAQNLVAAAEVFAVNSRSVFIGQYPVFGKIVSGDWKVLVTIAGTGTALLIAADFFPQEEQRELTQTVLHKLHDWNKSSVAELQDFLGFITSHVTAADQLPDAIGDWVTRSIPNADVTPIATRVLGLAVLKTFENWWA